MLYLSIQKNKIKVLYAKKPVIGQSQLGYFAKETQIDLLKEDTIPNVDILASAIKETVHGVNQTVPVKDKSVYLILPHELCTFLRIEIAPDLKPEAMSAFVESKIASTIPKTDNNISYDYYFTQSETSRNVFCYILQKSLYIKLQEIFRLLDLQINAIIPESLALFKLFEKTLRKNKTENIMYANLDKNMLTAFLYDSYGLEEKNKISHTLTAQKTAVHYLKEIGSEHEKKGKKINRLILSGPASDEIRQDTFTKDTGMWTNPFKRIAPQFYQEYLSILIPQAQQTPFPILEFDICFGAFICLIENKGFTLTRKTLTSKTSSPIPLFSPAKPKPIQPTLPTPFAPYPTKKINIPFVGKKEIALFFVFFIVTFAILMIGSNIKSPTSFLGAKPSPTLTPSPIPPTPTPTISITKDSIKIKVLNGSGTPGKASDAKTILKDKKYGEIITGNAQKFDYSVTEIAVKKEIEAIGPVIAKDIEEYAPKPKIIVLDSKETADVVITIGKDFK